MGFTEDVVDLKDKMAQSVSDTTSPVTAASADKAPKESSAFRSRLTDWLFKNLTLLFAFSAVLLIVGIAFTLFQASRLSIVHSHMSFYSPSGIKTSFSTIFWDPVAADADKLTGDIYRAAPFIYGTLVTSVLALLIAVPLGIGSAIFLSEIAPRWLSAPISFVIELLAAVPSIVYGFWALFFLVPHLQMLDAAGNQTGIESWLNRNFGHIPLFAKASDAGTGMDFMAAGLVLALMVLPFIAAVTRDILRTVPMAQREAAYGLGANKWETITTVVLKYAGSGIIGAVMLGLGRAIGETMAVTLVIGSKINLPTTSNLSSFSLFRPGYTMTSILADQYPSPNSNLQLSSLTQIAFTLFMVTMVVNGLARGLVWLTAMKVGGGTTSDIAEKAKRFYGGAGRAVASLLIIGAFLFQAFNDIKTHGAAGFFGGAEIIGVLAVGLFIAGRKAPGTSWFATWRQLSNRVGLSMAALCTLVGCVALLLLFGYVVKAGIGSLNASFFHRPDPANPEAGGMLHAIAGTVELILMACTMGIPMGVLGGIYLAEFGGNRLGFCIRYATDLLNGVPSIVLGIFAYTLVLFLKKALHAPDDGPAYQGFAGGFALGIMMIPTVMRTTEELVRLVPHGIREGSLALGATHATTVWKVVLPTARAGIVTGILLAVARVAGETAPLLMVGCNSQWWNLSPKNSIASLPVQIYVLHDSVLPLALQQSWGVAVILVLLVLVFNILARIMTRSRFATH